MGIGQAICRRHSVVEPEHGVGPHVVRQLCQTVDAAYTEAQVLDRELSRDLSAAGGRGGFTASTQKTPRRDATRRVRSF
jgi:hypothetical protein